MTRPAVAMPQWSCAILILLIPCVAMFLAWLSPPEAVYGWKTSAAWSNSGAIAWAWLCVWLAVLLVRGTLRKAGTASVIAAIAIVGTLAATLTWRLFHDAGDRGTLPSSEVRTVIERAADLYGVPPESPPPGRVLNSPLDGLFQLARAPAGTEGGQEFERIVQASPILFGSSMLSSGYVVLYRMNAERIDSSTIVAGVQGTPSASGDVVYEWGYADLYEEFGWPFRCISTVQREEGSSTGVPKPVLLSSSASLLVSGLPHAKVWLHQQAYAARLNGTALALDALIPTLLLLGAWKGWEACARWRRLGRCPKCGYSRRGLVSGACPECGEHIPRA